MILSEAEIRELTGKVQSNAQARALGLMGIEHRQRPDGSVVVLRAHLEKVLGGSVVSAKRKTAPDFSQYRPPRIYQYNQRTG